MSEFNDMVKRTIAEQHDRITALEAENAKLRDELDKWKRLTSNIEIPSYPITEFRPKDLERENDKLRELATETMRLMQTNGPDCGLCKHYDECWAGDAMNYSPSGCVICNEARELGIEVPE